MPPDDVAESDDAALAEPSSTNEEDSKAKTKSTSVPETLTFSTLLPKSNALKVDDAKSAGSSTTEGRINPLILPGMVLDGILIPSSC
jgi:hypothetical protein